MNRTNLVWKYFWQQKREEISEYFNSYGGYYCIYMILFGLCMQFLRMPEDGLEGEAVWLLGANIGLVLVGIWVLIGLIALIKVICRWLKSNWKEANKRADKDLRKLGDKRK